MSYGFNDSSQEFFKGGIIEHTMREIIQNSLDAKNNRHPDPVTVEIKLASVKKSTIGAGNLIRHVKASLKRSENDRQEKGIDFFKTALKILGKKEIPMLTIIDKNTTGLTNQKWNALVYQEGTPYKFGVSAPGGSFGIGKNAPYAASKLRLVCYSTRYFDRNRIEKFIARCKLVTHDDPKSNKELQHIGFGTDTTKLEKHRFPPILGKRIPEVFKLPIGGTGIFIVGFTENGWEDEAKQSIAENFFTAIHEKKLIVKIGDEQLTHATLNDVSFGDKNRRHYYETIKKPDHRTVINGEFGSFELLLTVNKKDMENRVAYVNKRGMMITDDKRFKTNPFNARLSLDMGKFAAVLWAIDNITDERIRKMEPPTHESIDYTRLDQPQLENTKKQLKAIQSDITKYIRGILEKDSETEQTNLSELAHILPFVSEPNNEEAKDHKPSRSKGIDHNIIPFTGPKDPEHTDDKAASGGGGLWHLKFYWWWQGKKYKDNWNRSHTQTQDNTPRRRTTHCIYA